MSRLWDRLIGQEKWLKDLDPHKTHLWARQAFAFMGRKGLGKKVLARTAAATLLCKEGRCGVCEDCLMIYEDRHPDVLVIHGSAEAKIRVADVEVLREHLKVKSFSGARIALLLNTEFLLEEAANRLLKGLEEPAPQSYWILTCDRPKHLLPTIRSRLCFFKVQPVPREELIPWVQKVLLEKKLFLSESELEALLREGAYSPGLIWRKIETEHGGDSPAGRVRELTQKILLSSSPTEVVSLIQQLTRTEKAPAQKIIESMEYNLNELYRKMIYKEVPQETALLTWRRRLLHEFKMKAYRENIAINTQLMVESLALLKFQKMAPNGWTI